MESTYISVADVAARWGCHPITIIRLYHKGILTGTKHAGGNKIWLTRDSVARYDQIIRDRARAKERAARAANTQLHLSFF